MSANLNENEDTEERVLRYIVFICRYTVYVVLECRILFVWVHWSYASAQHFVCVTLSRVYCIALI